MTVQRYYTGQEIDKDLGEGLDNVPHLTFGWDDFDFPVANLKINPATSKPDYDFAESEYLFDKATNETITGSRVTKHEFKMPCESWRPHIHWAQSATGIVKWQLEYKIWQADNVEPAFRTLTTVSQEFAYVDSVLHRISVFPDIDMSAYTSAAIMVKIKVTRLADDVADTYDADARFMSFDFHVPIDQPRGSRQEYIK